MNALIGIAGPQRRPALLTRIAARAGRAIALLRVAPLCAGALALASCGGPARAVNPAPAAGAASSPAMSPGEPASRAADPHFAEGNAEVVESPMPGSGVIALRILFYTGSVDDPPGREGLTALTARLMAEGGTRSMTYPQVLRALYPLAAEIGVHVDREQTVFAAEVHPDNVARLIPILAELVKAPRLEEADFARLKSDALNDIEKRLRATDDENLGKAMLDLMLYPREHPYGHLVSGTVEGLRAITLDDVRAHAPRAFGRRRMLIGIGGDFDPKVRAALVAALADLPEGERRLASVPPAPRFARTRVLIAEKPAQATAISIGFPHEQRRGTPDFHALGLVQSYFGEHRQFHGVLMQEMREKRGLNYGDYAYVEKFIQEAGGRFALSNIARRRQHFEIWIRPVGPGDAVFSIRLARYLLGQLVHDGLSGKGLEDTRTFLLGYTRLWDLTAERRLGFALDDHFYGTRGYLESYREALPQLTPTTVNTVIARDLSPTSLAIAVVAADGQALKQKLLSGEHTMKTYGAKVDDAVLAMDQAVSELPLGLEDGDITVVKADTLFVR